MDLEHLQTVDNEHPGPWRVQPEASSSYRVIDAMGKTAREGGYEGGTNEPKHKKEIEDINSYVAGMLAEITNRGKLSNEFFKRRSGLMDGWLTPEQAVRAAEPFKQLGMNHLANAITGIREAKKLLRKMQEFDPSDRSSLPPFSQFGALFGANTFTPESIGTTPEKLKELFQRDHNRMIDVFLENLRSGQYTDERSQYESLIFNLNLAGRDISSFSQEDQDLVRAGIEKYTEGSRKNASKDAKNCVNELRNGGRSDHELYGWYQLKLNMVGGKLTPSEVGLTADEEERLEKVIV